MFKSKFDILLCLSILSLLCFGFSNSACVLKYPDNIEVAPIYTKYFGRYILELPYTKSDIILQNDEIIYAKCRAKFSAIVKKRNHHYYNSYDSIIVENQTDITLKCVKDTLRLDNDMLEDNVLICENLDWSLYENDNKQELCKTKYGLAALLLATKSNFAHHILAEICFDLNDWSLQTIAYNVTKPIENVEILRDIAKTELITADVLGENLWNLKSTNNLDLTDSNLKAQIREMGQRNSWLHLANYELSPIVQGKLYENYFKEYSNILNIIWWSNLRLGNWKRFMDTLENYSHNNSFQLYAGTSGVVRKPIDNDADISTDLTIKFGFKNKPVPAYIWTYLTSIDKTNEDFIIVGYNSPYAEFFSRNEIVFCPDICNEIPWLKEISKSFNFNTAGIMFCCSPESLQHTNPLNGFPMKVLNSRMSSTAQQENDTATEDATIKVFSTTSTTEQTTIPNTEIYLTSAAYNGIRSEELIDNGIEERYIDDEEHNDDD